MQTKNKNTVRNAYKKLALACIKDAIKKKDFSLLSKSPLYSERLDLLCEIAEIDRNKVIKRLEEVRKDKRKSSYEKKLAYMREYNRRKCAAETAEERERRLAKRRESYYRQKARRISL